MGKDKLARLRQITALARDVELNKMARLQRENTALAQQLRDLDQAVSQRACAAVDDVARRVGADSIWLRWVDSRKIAINTTRAQLLAQIDAERASVARAFGRDQVAQKIKRKR